MLTRKHGLGVTGDSLNFIEEALADGDDTFMHEMIGRIAQLFLNVEG